MADLVGAIDHGTTSTRFMLFAHSGREVGRSPLEHAQILPPSPPWASLPSPHRVWAR